MIVIKNEPDKEIKQYINSLCEILKKKFVINLDIPNINCYYYKKPDAHIFKRKKYAGTVSLWKIPDEICIHGSQATFYEVAKEIEKLGIKVIIYE